MLRLPGLEVVMKPTLVPKAPPLGGVPGSRALGLAPRVPFPMQQRPRTKGVTKA
jgi:hypothetical protein